MRPREVSLLMKKHRWDAAVRPTWSEETGTKVEEKDLLVFELANDDVV